MVLLEGESKSEKEPGRDEYMQTLTASATFLLKKKTRDNLKQIEKNFMI